MQLVARTKNVKIVRRCFLSVRATLLHFGWFADLNADCIIVQVGDGETARYGILKLVFNRLSQRRVGQIVFKSLEK